MDNRRHATAEPAGAVQSDGFFLSARLKSKSFLKARGGTQRTLKRRLDAMERRQATHHKFKLQLDPCEDEPLRRRKGAAHPEGEEATPGSPADLTNSNGPDEDGLL